MTLRIPFHSRSHLKTKFIELVPSNCRACWECVAACPQHVLGKAILFKHRHAHVDHAQACKGCKKCVRACPHDAIRTIPIPTANPNQAFTQM